MKLFKIFLMIFFFLIAFTAKPQTEIKINHPFANGSDQIELLQKTAAAISSKTKNQITINFIYTAPLSYNQTSIVNQLKQNTTDAAFLTVQGLSKIHTDFNVLDLPFSICTRNEADLVESNLSNDFKLLFENNSFVLGCWANPGTEYLFSNNKVTNLNELKVQKVGFRGYDNTLKAFFVKAGISGILAEAIETLSLLTTGQINAYYGNCINTLSNNWNSKVKYLCDTPVRYSVGAFVFRTGAINTLDAKQKTALLTEFKHLGKKLNDLYSKENSRAKNLLSRKGISAVQITAASKDEMITKAKLAWVEKAGTLYSAGILTNVRNLLGK